MGTHSQHLLQNCLLDVAKLGWDDVLMARTCIKGVRQIGPGQIQGRVKLGHQGSPSSRNFFDRKATATNLMHSNDLEVCVMKCCYFWFLSEVKFLTRFDVFLDLVILPYFNAISILGFLCGKVLHLHLFCVISMFLCGRRLKNLNEFFMYLHFI